MRDFVSLECTHIIKLCGGALVKPACATPAEFLHFPHLSSCSPLHLVIFH